MLRSIGLSQSINQRSQVENYIYLPRNRLVIAVPQALRPSGNEMVRLAKPLRDNVAELIRSVDEFNAIIDTTDPRHRDNACLNPKHKADLAKMLRLGLGTSAALEKIRDEELEIARVDGYRTRFFDDPGIALCPVIAAIALDAEAETIMFDFV
jgi:hypothetical protein